MSDVPFRDVLIAAVKRLAGDFFGWRIQQQFSRFRDVRGVDLFPAALDPERLWRIAGVATLIGLAVYEDAERFIAPRAEP